MEQKPKLTEKQYYVVFAFVTSLFMLWGIAITMGDVLNSHFQNVLHVSKAESSLVQFSIFGAYAVMGIPAGLFMKKFGYKNGVLFGLSLYAIGAFLFIPAANAESFNFFRLALFVLACGLATLETVAHPFVASLGNQATSDQRINFAQTFNGVGAVIGPLLGKFFVFGTLIAATDGPLTSVKVLYTSIAIVIAIIAVSFAFVKVPALTDPHVIATDTYAIAPEGHVEKGLFSNKHFVFAVVAQFFNVAAQAGTWAYFINYGHDVMGMEHDEASGYMALFMVMMIVGRFTGTVLMNFIKPYKLLAIFAFGSIVSCLIVAQAWGWVSFVTLFFVNFFFSIMFPTIFSLGLKDLGPKTQQASSFIVMGVVGGAVFPYVMGLIADKNVAHAYYLPIVCYAVIFFFAFLYPKLNKKAQL